MSLYRRVFIITLATAPVVRAAGYDTPVVPLTYSNQITIPGRIQPGCATGGQFVGYDEYTVYSTTDENALAWSTATSAAVNLNPTGITSSVASGTDGMHEVGGVVGASTGGQSHAVLWNGSAGQYVDLNPTMLPGINNSSASSVAAGQEFGTGGNSSSGNLDPILWTGTAASAIDLKPTNLGTTFLSFQAVATDGTNQVGAGNTTGALQQNGWHALLWSEAANTAVDLSPTNFPSLTNSYAYGVGGTQQVGVGYANVSNDPLGPVVYTPLLWNGSGASAVSLYPSSLSNVISAEALGTNGKQQVGLAQFSGGTQDAVAWSGTAASVVDLNPYLPAGASWTSVADSIDSSGDAYGIASHVGSNSSYGVEWIPQNASGGIVVGSGVQYQIGASGSSSVSTRAISGLTINANGLAGVQQSSNSSNRQLIQLSAPGLVMSGANNGWTGEFDLSDNDLDIAGGSLATVMNQVQQGFNSGRWNGSGGVVSSAAAADTRHLTALGVIQNNQSGSALFTAANPFDGTTPGAGDILVKYTYYGDANLDGRIDGSDYSRIDYGYLNHLTGWFNGDFNYDNVVNGSDYTLIDNAFNSQGAVIDTSIASQAVLPTSIVDATAFGETTPVPEPASIAGVILTGGLLIRRRRRR